MKLFGRKRETRGVAGLSAQQVKQQLDEGRDLVIVDVRQPTGFDVFPGTIPGSIRIPPSELPERYGEVPRDRPLVLFCT